MTATAAGPGDGTVLELDCRGRRCPLPILDLARHIGAVPIGGRVRVAADDPAAAADVPAWCRMRGHSYLGCVRATDGTPTYTVRRTH